MKLLQLLEQLQIRAVAMWKRRLLLLLLKTCSIVISINNKNSALLFNLYRREKKEFAQSLVLGKLGQDFSDTTLAEMVCAIFGSSNLSNLNY
ncbi:hypothetical protein X798_05395 [Onchocerca flexuosa]|uniref:Uncharacterized protein n=1 Tax=Onchocerca flexuosa TaxID=387005 RepID=A0A238BSE2_9BILA|nr:hypothetical protein X798_05395 [Onchocerca flexuosa]